MAVIETKADQLIALLDHRKTITAKEAATELGVTEGYVRTLANVLHKNKLLGISAGAFSLTLKAVLKDT